MELKISTIKTKLNESISKNQNLKFQIDEMRREKNLFD